MTLSPLSTALKLHSFRFCVLSNDSAATIQKDATTSDIIIIVKSIWWASCTKRRTASCYLRMPANWLWLLEWPCRILQDEVQSGLLILHTFATTSNRFHTICSDELHRQHERVRVDSRTQTGTRGSDGREESYSSRKCLHAFRTRARLFDKEITCMMSLAVSGSTQWFSVSVTHTQTKPHSFITFKKGLPLIAKSWFTAMEHPAALSHTYTHFLIN